jgi:hypothetical protein
MKCKYYLIATFFKILDSEGVKERTVILLRDIKKMDFEFNLKMLALLSCCVSIVKKIV